MAELWLTRDWSLYQRWTATPTSAWSAAGIPASDGNLARAAVVEAGRAFATRLTAALKSEGLGTGYPLIVWRDREGFMKACACNDSRSWAFIRDDLNAPDRVAASGARDSAPVTPGADPESLPYPTLPPLDPAAAGSPVVTPPAAPPAPATPPTPRAPPQATKQDDTTFF